MHSRQILLNKVSLVKIQLAESSGDASALALAKVRFEDLQYNEVTFKSIKKDPKVNTKFSGVIELTHRDGHTFNQKWLAADSVNFFKTTQHVTVSTVETFKDIIKPGLYFVTDVNEMVVLLRDEMNVNDVLGLLGYDFEDGEVELIERHVKLESPMVIGSLPVRRIFKKEDGTYSDGTRLSVTLSEDNDGVLPGNPDKNPVLTVNYLPKVKATQVKDGGKVLKDGSKLVTVTIIGGTDKPIITGELVNGKFVTPIDLSDVVGNDVSFLVTVGLADDVRTPEYSVQYVAENWTFQPITEPKYTRVGYPLELSGILSSDLGNEPWGDAKVTVIQPDGSTEVKELPSTGTVSIETTPAVEGELNIDFKCGEGDNTVNVNYQIQPPVALDELAFSEVVVASSILNPEQLLELSGELKAFDGTTRTDAEVKVLFDKQEQSVISPDIEGNLVASLPVANDDLEDRVIDVTLKHLELETAPIKVTIKPSAQVPHRFEILNDSGVIGSPGEFKFLIYDTKDRMIIGAEGTYSIEGDANEYPFTSVDEYYVIDMGAGQEGVTEAYTVSVTLKCQGLTDNTHQFSWAPGMSVDDFAILSGGFNYPTYNPGVTTDLSFDYVLDNPDSIPADKVTLTATAIDNDGETRTVFESVIDNQIDGHIENIEGFETGFIGKDLNVEVVYLIEFKGVTKEITKVYPLTVELASPALTSVALDPTLPTEAIVQTGILLNGTALDQYGEPFYEEGLKLYVSGASFNPDEVVVNPDGTFEIMVSHRHNIFSATFSVRPTSSTYTAPLASHSVNFVKGDKFTSATFDPWNQQKYSLGETAVVTGTLVHSVTGDTLPDTDFWASLSSNRTTMKMFRSDAEGRFVMTFDKPADSSTSSDVRVFDDQGGYVTNPLSWSATNDVITVDQDTLTLNAGEPLFISGTFMKSNGSPNTYALNVYDTGTGVLLGKTTKPVDGHWTFTGETGVAGETQEIAVSTFTGNTAKVTVNWVTSPVVPATIEFASDAVTEVQVNDVQPASVNGTVKDSGGDPVPNATFTYVIDPDTVEPVNGTTDDLGEFEIEVDISTTGTKTLTVTTENNVEASHVINVTDIA